MKLEKFAPVFAASVIAMTALSGLWTVNVQHHWDVPKQLDMSVVSERSTLHSTYPFKTMTYDINMKDEIKGTNTILHIVQTLQNAQKGDTIVFHLAGYGGDVSSVLDIISNINKSKAYVIMSVEAPVYSGHAYLALMGNKLIMAPYSFLMLHESTAVNMDCETKTEQYDPNGLDRGVSNREHCLAAKIANVTLGNALILGLPLITQEEKSSLMQGHDLYLFSSDIARRQQGK